MPNIHTLDPKRRSSKEKQFCDELNTLANKYIGEIPLISAIGMIELIKLELVRNQYAVMRDGTPYDEN